MLDFPQYINFMFSKDFSILRRKASKAQNCIYTRVLKKHQNIFLVNFFVFYFKSVLILGILVQNQLKRYVARCSKVYYYMQRTLYKKNLDTTSGRGTYYLLLLCSLSLIPYRHFLYTLLTFSGKGAQQTWTRGGFSRHSPFSSLVKVFSIELIVQKRSYLSHNKAKLTIYVQKVGFFEMKKQNF